MVQIIKENKPLSLSDRFGNAFGKAAEVIPNYLVDRNNQLAQEKRMMGENEALKAQGIDLTDINDPNIRKEIISSKLKGANALALQDKKSQAANALKSAQAEQEKEEKDLTFQSALSRVNKMRELRKKGNLGRGSSFFGLAGGDTARDRGEYEQLGKSLISFASTIPIRNKEEFKVLAESLYDPSITDAEADGILTAMEKILNDGMGIADSESKKPSAGMKINQSEPTKRPRPTAWDSQSAAKQNQNQPITLEIVQDLFKKAGGDKEKARQMATQMGYQI